MKEANGLSSVIENLESMLDMIFITGMNTVQENVIEELRELGEMCGSFGLAFGEKRAVELAKELESKRHSLYFEVEGLMDKYCELSFYVDAVRNKLEIKNIRDEMEGGKMDAATL